MKVFIAMMILLVCGACRGWPEMQQDTQQFQAILKVYRSETAAITPTHTAQVQALGERLDSIAGHMGDLSK